MLKILRNCTGIRNGAFHQWVLVNVLSLVCVVFTSTL